MKLLLGILAIIGVFLGWITALDAPHMRSARNVGRFGYALAALCIAALVTLPGCSTIATGAKYCLDHIDHCN